jgi:alpha-ribazole phosphatase/probable phosphoglycerate mutase
VTLTLDFLRHGTPVGGRRYRGQIDDALSPEGWEEMRRALGDAVPWQGLLSSPLRRCREFAEDLAARHALPLTLEPALREIGFGVWEGKTRAEIEAEYPGALQRFKQDPLVWRPSGAEPLDAFAQRIHTALDGLLMRALVRPGQTHLLVICHAGSIRMALADALALPLNNAYRVDVPSAGLTRIQYSGLPHAPQASLLFHGRRRLD